MAFVGAKADRAPRGRLNGLSARGHSIEPLACFLDASMLFALGLTCAAAYHIAVLKADMANFALANYVALSLLSSVLYAALARGTGYYHYYFITPPLDGARRSSFIWFSVIALLSIVGFLLKSGHIFSRGVLTIYFVVGAFALPTTRLVWQRLYALLLSRQIIQATKILLLRPKECEGFARSAHVAAKLGESGFELTHEAELNLKRIDKLKNLVPEIRDLIAENRVNEVFIELPAKHLELADKVVHELRLLPVPVRLILDPITQSVIERPTNHVGDLFVSEFQRAPLTHREQIEKRILDLSVATSAIIFLAPLMLMTALMIKLDSPGPILFRQDRKGFSGKKFIIYKFRSMRVTENGPGLKQATLGDNRVTRVGRVIRRTSIDELPQLWNVIRGDMSIVGPRPHAVAHDDYYEKFISEYALRHHTKPGLTGLAQVRGLRGETPRIEDMRARIDTDLNYINSWSIWNDIKIIFMTALVLLHQKKAY